MKLMPYTYETFQVGNYFNLKSRTRTPLVFNVVYRFSYPRGADLTYIRKSTRYVVTRAMEDWAFKQHGVVNGPTSSGQTPAQTRKLI